MIFILQNYAWLKPLQTFLVFQDVFTVTLFVFQDVFKSLQDVLKTCLQDVLQLCLQDVFKMSSRRLGRQKNVTLKRSSRRLQDVFSTFSPRRMFAGYGALILTLEFQSNSTKNMKHVNLAPKDVQRILSSHKSIMNRECSKRKLFLKIPQYSQENTCVGISFLIKMQVFRPPALLKRESNTSAIADIEKFSRTPISKNIC